MGLAGRVCRRMETGLRPSFTLAQAGGVAKGLFAVPLADHIPRPPNRFCLHAMGFASHPAAIKLGGNTRMLKHLTLGVVAVLLTAVPAVACESIAAKAVKIGACVDATWVKQEASENQDAFYYSDDGNIGFVMVGTQVNASVSDFRKAIIDQASKTGTDVKVVGERTENVGGKPWNVIEYDTTINGTVFLFTEFYYIAPGFGSAEFIYWTIPDLATQAAFRAGQLMSSVEFTN
jgi:hypothetical protein